MSFTITAETGFSEPIPLQETAERVTDSIMTLLSCPYETEVTLLLTDNEEIREINREQRGIDSPTDVLSFPYQEYTVPGDFSGFEDCPDAFDPESGELMLGDIVISCERAEAQAEEYGHSVLREYAFLIAHSLLHLCGYDHETPEEAEIMENLQRKGLDSVGITR